MHEWSEKDRADFGALGRRKNYSTGDVLFMEGDISDRVLLLRTGRVKIATSSDDGQEVMLALRGPGDLIGELSVVDGGPRSASAYAVEDVEAVVVAASHYADFLERHPKLLLAQLRTVVARLRDADEKRIELSAYGSERRIAKRLVELAETQGEETSDGIRLDVSLSQDELGAWTGASREAVARALRRFRDGGMVTTDRRKIVVTDLGALRRRADI